MTRLRTTLVALVAVLAGAAVGLGQAQADSTTSSSATTTAPAPNTIVVNGTDTIAAAPDSSAADDQSTYQTALADAITDARTKASLIASQIGATLGSITNVTENSDSSDLCQGPIFLPATAKPTSTTGASSHHKHGRVAKAFRADVIANGCSIEADVTLTFDMTPAA